MKKRFHIRTSNYADLQELVSHLAYRSCWFEFEPLPDAEYYITIKDNMAFLIHNLLDKDQILEIKNLEG